MAVSEVAEGTVASMFVSGFLEKKILSKPLAQCRKGFTS